MFLETLACGTGCCAFAFILNKFKNLDKVSIGLTSGIDSRLVLSSGIEDFQGEWLSFTFGGEKCIDRDTAKEIAKYYNIKHLPIEIDDLSYMNYGHDGVFYTGGASLFQMGLQIHLYASLKENFQCQGLIEAPATGFIIGGQLQPGNCHDLKSKEELLSYYENYFFNFNKETFCNLFSNKKSGMEYYQLTIDKISNSLDKMVNDKILDIHHSFIFHERTKRWANYNMVNILYSHRPILPTYDNDFLNVMSKIPSEMRQDGSFRSNLLSYIDKNVADFIYDQWMQPAWLCPPYTENFKLIVEEIEKAQQKVWYDSGKKIYLKSNRFEANFLEYIRVYPEYQKYFKDLLIGEDSILSDLYFSRKSISSLIESHISGKSENHKILFFLLSAELTCRIFEKNETVNVNNEFNYFSNLDYVK